MPFLSKAGGQLDEMTTRLARRPHNPDKPTAPRLSWFGKKRRMSILGQLGPALEYTMTDDASKKTATQKLNTFSGVFMPTTLNVLSILMFLRFSFIVGQVGFLGSMALLIISYALDLLTVLSISAISSNGTVRGGGAYYMISRTLGPEFGGSIGIVFYIGQVLNAGMNIVGFFEPLIDNFGKSAHAEHGHGWLPDSFWFVFLYGSIMCFICSVICTGGSKFFSRVGIAIFVLLGISTLSIPFSGVVRTVFGLHTHAWQPSWATIRDNMFAHFTKGAAGSETTQRESWKSIFGLLFPATAGIFAGSADSGQLKSPSKSIPRGTLYGLTLTFALYTSVIAVLAFGVPRAILHKDLIILQQINLTKYLIILGALSTATFSTLCGINGAAKMLQAIARDDAFPFLSVFKYGTKATDEPLLAILITWLFTQLVLFADINMIASAVTMTFLLTFAGINLACFLLDVSSAPNFRPSFQYYSWHTALLGFISSFVTGFYIDGAIACGAFAFLGTLFLMVHYFGAPKNYGDVSQALIYHQVRKFLLRLDSKEHVKFWRPQILLLVNDPRASLNLIKFCNAIKKSGLYILGHVLITDDFTKDLPELRKQQTAFARLVQLLKVKAFVQVGVSTDEIWGAMNMCLSSGLGGMKPNIVVMSFFNMDSYREGRSTTEATPAAAAITASEVTPLLQKRKTDDSNREREFLPTDVCRRNPPIGMQTYVNIVEDVIASFNLNIALTRGFRKLQFPEESDKKYIDLWPIQMSPVTGADSTGEILSTNFDTYTMILQMGQILHTVPKWHNAFGLRVIVFVEYKEDVEEEERRIQLLLDNLRIDAKLVVLTLDCGQFDGYDVCVKNCTEKHRLEPVQAALSSQSWWKHRHSLRPAYTVPRPRGQSFSRHGSDSDGVAVAKRRLSQHMQPYSMPLSFRTSIPIPQGDESSSDEEDFYDPSDIRPFDAETQIEHVGRSDAPGRRLRRQPSQYPQQQSPIMDESTENAIDDADDDDEELGNSYNKTKFSSSVISSTIPDVLDHPAVDDAVEASAGPDLQDAGPSITFAPEPEVPGRNYAGNLSFNDMPPSAQHYIINELIQSQSQDTAVVLTTLPPPNAGTYKEIEASEAWLASLDLLTRDLPPVFLIHSKSLTVTTAL